MGYARLLLLRSRVAPAAALTDPTTLPSLSGWWKGDGVLWQDSGRTTPATANDHPVGAWDDASGNARHALQVTAGKRPLLKTAAQNGRSIVLADGVDDFLATGAFTVDQPLTMYLAMKIHTVGAPGVNDIVVGMGGGVVVFGADTTPQTSVYAGLGVFYSQVVANGAYAAVTAKFNGASSVLRENGTERATGNAGAANGAYVAFASLFDTGGRHTHVGLAEVLLYGAAHTLAQMQSVEAYLKTRWGTP